MNTDAWLSGVAKDPVLTPVQRSVALALWSFMDRAGTCYPSVESLGARAGIKKRDTARAALLVLIERGHLARVLQPGGRYSTNRYKAVDNRGRPPVERVTPVTRLPGVRPPVERAPLGPPANGSRTYPERTYAREAEDLRHPFIAALVAGKTL